MKRIILTITILYLFITIAFGQELFRFIDYDLFIQDLKKNGPKVLENNYIYYENFLYLSKEVYKELKKADSKLYIDTTNCFTPVPPESTRYFETELNSIKDLFYNQDYFNVITKDLPLYQKDCKYKLLNEIYIKDNSVIFTIDYYPNFSVTYRGFLIKERRKLRIDYLYSIIED